jgi:hypothetical protein
MSVAGKNSIDGENVQKNVNRNYIEASRSKTRQLYASAALRFFLAGESYLHIVRRRNCPIRDKVWGRVAESG